VIDAQTAASANDLHAALQPRLGKGRMVLGRYRHIEVRCMTIYD
jgi:hypothetical protein